MLMFMCIHIINSGYLGNLARRLLRSPVCMHSKILQDCLNLLYSTFDNEVSLTTQVLPHRQPLNLMFLQVIVHTVHAYICLSQICTHH